MPRAVRQFSAVSMPDCKNCTADLPVTLINLTAPDAARAMRSPVNCGPPGAAQSLRLPGSYPDRHASPRNSFWPPDSHRCGPLLPLLPAWHWGWARYRGAETGKNKWACADGACPQTHTINMQRVRGQLRPLSASCGTALADPPGSLVYGAAQQTPDTLKPHNKHRGSGSSLPRDDPGHPMGGAAPNGPP